MTPPCSATAQKTRNSRDSISGRSHPRPDPAERTRFWQRSGWERRRNRGRRLEMPLAAGTRRHSWRSGQSGVRRAMRSCAGSKADGGWVFHGDDGVVHLGAAGADGITFAPVRELVPDTSQRFRTQAAGADPLEGRETTERTGSSRERGGRAMKSARVGGEFEKLTMLCQPSAPRSPNRSARRGSGRNAKPRSNLVRRPASSATFQAALCEAAINAGSQSRR
jgi:hypothetical protein